MSETADVQRSVTISASPAQVWEEILAGDWLGDDVELRPVVGGDGVVRDGDEIRHLVVESVVAGERLEFRWWALHPDGVGPSSRVIVTVQRLPVEDDPADAVATQVVVAESPVPAAAPLPPSGPLALAHV